MLDWKQFFLAYLRSRSRLFVYLLALAFLLKLFPKETELPSPHREFPGDRPAFPPICPK